MDSHRLTDMTSVQWGRGVLVNSTPRETDRRGLGGGSALEASGLTQLLEQLRAAAQALVRHARSDVMTRVTRELCRFPERPAPAAETEQTLKT